MTPTRHRYSTTGCNRATWHSRASAHGVAQYNSRAVNGIFQNPVQRWASGGTLILLCVSKIAEMNESDPWLFIESKNFQIGSVEKYLWLLKIGEISKKPENPRNFIKIRPRNPRFRVKNCPKSRKSPKTQIVGLIMPIDIFVLLY